MHTACHKIAAATNIALVQGPKHKLADANKESCHRPYFSDSTQSSALSVSHSPLQIRYSLCHEVFRWMHHVIRGNVCLSFIIHLRHRNASPHAVEIINQPKTTPADDVNPFAIIYYRAVCAHTNTFFKKISLVNWSREPWHGWRVKCKLDCCFLRVIEECNLTSEMEE